MANDFLHLVKRITCLGPVGILVKNDIDAGGLGDVINKTNRGACAASEPQPMVRRHQQYCVSSRFASSNGVVDCLEAALCGNSGNHFDCSLGQGNFVGYQ